MSGLTLIQQKLLLHIIDYTDEHDRSPTFQEMADAVGLSSKSGVDRILHCLHADGWLTWGGHRNITILRRPASRDPYAPDRLAALSPAKFEKLALDVVTLQARRAAA